VLHAHSTSTLLDRALDLLAQGPRSADDLAQTVLGLSQAPPAVAERLSAALLDGDPRVQRTAAGTWCLVPAAQGSPSLEDCVFAVVDVETTGARAAGGDRVIEVAVVVVHGVRREVVLDRLINPGRPIPRGVSVLTRISDGDVRAAPPFAAIAEEVLGALSGRVFVAHNARFDWSFLAAEVRRTRALALNGPRLCTARLARRLVREAESCGLDWLTEYFGLENPARHRAAGDAWATAQLLARLVERARSEGARTLQDLEGLQVKRPRHRKRRRRGAPEG
jgi:DNA polymerase-3 subunit epsilon